ncbi:MAG: TA system VapC family ribonuclease toxin [Luteolibacter sp.]
MLFDSNVWLALTFSAHPHHALAKGIFAKASAENPACFCRATQQSFLRLATTPAILHAYGAEGFTNQNAAKLIQTLINLPAVHILDEPTGLQSRWLDLAGIPSASPKVWMDAYLAAFAILHQTEFVTLDRDFQNLVKHGLRLRLLSEAE